MKKTILGLLVILVMYNVHHTLCRNEPTKATVYSFSLLNPPSALLRRYRHHKRLETLLSSSSQSPPSSPVVAVVDQVQGDNNDNDNGTPTQQPRRRFMYMTDEEDRILKSKGDMEASLMKKPKPIKPFKFRPTGGFGSGGGGGGLGLGKSTTKSSKKKSKGGRKVSSNTGNSKSDKIDEATEDPDIAMVQAIVETIKTDGIVRLDGVLSGDNADSLRDYLIDLRARATEQVESGSVDGIEIDSQERFADVLLNQNRCDLKIPLGPKPVHQALLDLLTSASSTSSSLSTGKSSSSGGGSNGNNNGNGSSNYSLVRKVIEGVFETYGGSGRESTLWELNCFMSNSGARRQLVHADNVCLEPVVGLHPPSSPSAGGSSTTGNGRADEPILLTCFVALQDIDETMGPTIFMPGTHTIDAHNRFFETGRDESSTKTESFSPKNDVLRRSPAVVGAPVPKGSCLIFDPRVLHCAGENTCSDVDKTRALFYMSFKNPKIDSPGCPSTSGYGIGTAELTMDELVREVTIYESDVIEDKFTPRLSSLLSFP